MVDVRFFQRPCFRLDELSVLQREWMLGRGGQLVWWDPHWNGRSSGLQPTECIRVFDGELKRLGSTLVDPVDDPALGRFGNAGSAVLHYELKAGIRAYLDSLRSGAPLRRLKDLIEFNIRNRDREICYFGQEHFLQAQEKGPLTNKDYVEALEKCRHL
jgi:hypothetical protein